MNLKRSLKSLYFTQFLSAFADNAVFFIILGMLSQKGIQDPESHMVVVQAGFLLAYVLLAALFHIPIDTKIISNCTN